MQVADERQVDFAGAGGAIEGAAVLQDGLRGFGCGHGVGKLFVFPGFLLQSRQGFFDGLQVGEDQFGIDSINIAGGVDFAVHVNDVFVGEGPNHLADGVGFPNVGEEGVTAALAVGSALDDASNVDKGHGGGQDAFGGENFGEPRKAGVGQFDQPNIGVDGGKGIVGGQDIATGQGVKKG